MQTTLLCAFCKQPPKQKGDYSKLNADIEIDIEEKRETIAELRKEIKDAEEEIERVEQEELELVPDPGEEDIFDCYLPTLEEDFNELKYENESQIRTLEEEIRDLEKKMK